MFFRVPSLSKEKGQFLFPPCPGSHPLIAFEFAEYAQIGQNEVSKITRHVREAPSGEAAIANDAQAFFSVGNL